MNEKQASLDYVHLMKESVLGNNVWEGNLDLLNIVLIGLPNDIPDNNEENELHRLLSTLFSKTLSSEERLSIIETEYEIPIEDSLREDVNTMCNLSQGVIEFGMAKRDIEIIINMHKKGYTIEQIVDVTEKTPEEVEKIIKEKPTLI